MRAAIVLAAHILLTSGMLVIAVLARDDLESWAHIGQAVAASLAVYGGAALLAFAPGIEEWIGERARRRAAMREIRHHEEALAHLEGRPLEETVSGGLTEAGRDRIIGNARRAIARLERTLA